MSKRQKIRHGLILVSFFLFPATFYYLSPVLIVQAAAGGIINGSLLVFTLLFLSALVLGRGWCGWLCPAAGCQEAMFKVNKERIFRGRWIKWAIWIPWIAAITLLAVKAGGYIRFEPLYQTRYGLSVTDVPSLIVYFLVLFLLIIIPGLVFGRRSFCHHLCWMAPFMILGRTIAVGIKIPSLQLKAEKAKCVQCHRCSEQCPMSLEVEKMVETEQMENKECILCGSCADTCKEKTIHLGFR